jgi:hypothetical protein
VEGSKAWLEAVGYSEMAIETFWEVGVGVGVRVWGGVLSLSLSLCVSFSLSLCLFFSLSSLSLTLCLSLCVWTGGVNVWVAVGGCMGGDIRSASNPKSHRHTHTSPTPTNIPNTKTHHHHFRHHHPSSTHTHTPQVFCDALKELPTQTPQALHEQFNQEGGGAEASYLVWYCRLLTAGACVSPGFGLVFSR